MFCNFLDFYFIIKCSCILENATANNKFKNDYSLEKVGLGANPSSR